MSLLLVIVTCILECVHNRNYNVKESGQPVQTATSWWLASLYIDTFSFFTLGDFNNVYLPAKRIHLTRYPRVSHTHTNTHTGFLAQAVCMQPTLCFAAKELFIQLSSVTLSEPTVLRAKPSLTFLPCEWPQGSRSSCTDLHRGAYWQAAAVEWYQTLHQSLSPLSSLTGNPSFFVYWFQTLVASFWM